MDMVLLSMQASVCLENIMKMLSFSFPVEMRTVMKQKCKSVSFLYREHWLVNQLKCVICFVNNMCRLILKCTEGDHNYHGYIRTRGYMEAEKS